MRRVRLIVAMVAAAVAAFVPASTGGAAPDDRTVWLCRPGLAHNPCTASLAATRVGATGKRAVVSARPAANPRFDCFYVYPTVSTEPTPNADLRIQQNQIDVAVAQASRFSQVCRVYAPVYRQITLSAILAHPTLDLPFSYGLIAYESLLAGFRDYLAHDNHGRPIVFIGHSQGASILIHLLAQEVDGNRSLRDRLLLAILLGGNVEVKRGSLAGGSFVHIPLCSRAGQAGCVIAYSSFPGTPPATALFGRVRQGGAGLAVACVNPAAPGGGRSVLDTFVPSEGTAETPWLEYPGLYSARCRSAGGAGWLEVTKATGVSDKRPTVTEDAGPDWGYHRYDVNLALGNLVADVAGAGKTWLRTHRTG